MLLFPRKISWLQAIPLSSMRPANDVHFGEMKLELKPNLSAKSNPDEIDLEEHE